MKKFNFYRIDEEAVVLIDNYSAKEYDIEPFVRGVHKSAYCIDDVRELLEAGRLEECLTYDDRYSSYGGDDEIKEIEVENFENPNDTVIEWLTLTWIEQEREEKIDAYVAEHDIEMVETTSQANGYPSNLKYAYIGFETFEQAEEFANKFNMELAILDKHNGWQLWHRGNTAWEAFHIDSNDYGDNYCHFRASDAENFYEENVKPCLEEFDSFEGLEEFIKKEKQILEAIENLRENEIVVTHWGEYYDTVQEYTMQWNHDSKYYAIGAIKEEY